MQLVRFSQVGWEQWAVDRRPAIPDGMPLLVDDDLRLEDGLGTPRPAAVVNSWLRELPSCGGPSPRTWITYARILRSWLCFLGTHGIDPFGSQADLRRALSVYAAHRSVGPVEARFEASTWNQHVSVLVVFYRWAQAEGFAGAEPFTYRYAYSRFADQVSRREANAARRRTPKPHVSIKYLERDFVDLLMHALGGRGHDGFDDPGYRGRQLLRNEAVIGLAVSTGLRSQEFTYLLVDEIPPLPGMPTDLPIPFPVPASLCKGRKHRTTWIDYGALAKVHRYIQLGRAVASFQSQWKALEAFKRIALSQIAAQHDEIQRLRNLLTQPHNVRALPASRR